MQGRNFVGMGPTLEELRGSPDGPPRSRCGRTSGWPRAADVGERAELAVRELERAGGFDREVLVVVTTTGTGWVDPAASDSLEYEFNGDTAMVAMQYSYLPSWLSFLVDQVKARDAGRALFDAVYGEWAQLPPDVSPEALRLRREPGHLRRGGRVQRARRHREPDRRRAVGRAAQLQRAVARASSRTATPDRRSGCPSRTGRNVRFADEAPDLDRPPGAWGSRASSTCRTPRTPSSGGRPG